MLRLAVCAVLFVVSGCQASAGAIPSFNQSVAEVSEGNFRVVSTGLKADASCAFVFNAFPMGDAAIRTAVMNELVDQADLSGGNGKRALANISWDVNVSNILYIWVEYTVVARADVIEYD